MHSTVTACASVPAIDRRALRAIRPNAVFKAAVVHRPRHAGRCRLTRANAESDKMKSEADKGLERAEEAGSGFVGAVQQGVDKIKETLTGAVSGAEKFREDREAEAENVASHLPDEVGKPTGGPKPRGEDNPPPAGPAGQTLTSSAGPKKEENYGAGVDKEAMKQSDEMLSNEAKKAQRAGQARAEGIKLPDYPTYKAGTDAVEDKKPGQGGN